MESTENVLIDKLSSKEETTNYCKIIILMVDVGTETLLHLFYSLLHLFFPNHTVKSYFASKKSEIECGTRTKVFDKSQYAKLTCPDPNPDEFDISLLIKLLTYFKLSPINLHNLQDIRNEIIGHKSRAELTKLYFESLWVQVENILLNIARCVSGDEERATKLKIDELKQKVLEVSEREKKIIKAFETWCQEEITVLLVNMENLRVVITENTDKNTESIERLKEQVNELTGKIQNLIQRLDDLVNESQHPANRQYTLNDTPDTSLNEKVSIVGLHRSIAEKNLSVEEWDILKMLQRDLISYYRKMLSKLQLSPLFEEEGYAANLFYIYVKPNITILGQKMSKRQSESTPVTFHDIFDFKPCQNIYISSPAGCGKTSFAKYLALIWCQAHLPVESDNQWISEDDVNEMRTFRFLFFVFLRDSHRIECDVDNMIQNQLLPNLANSATYAELGLKFLQNILTNVKCIIILDGLDEWGHPSGNMCHMTNKDIQHTTQIPYSRARPLCTTLTTSRPWKLDVVKLKPEDIDQKLELNVLEDDLLAKLIEKVVKLMNELHRKEKNAKHFLQELRRNKLDALSKIPVLVMQLLTLWYDDKPFGKSQCEIYSNIVEFLFERHFKKLYNDCEIENRYVENCSSDQQIPVCFQCDMQCKTHVDLLSKLGELAVDTLFGDSQESSLVFNVLVVKKYLSDDELNMSLAVGILTQEKVSVKLSERQSNVSFLHKTLQEFFTALYITINPGKRMSILENIKCICSSIEKILEMSQICMFLSGLCPEVMSQLCEHLRDTVSADSRTRDYRASGELSPWWSSEGGTLRRVQDTMVGWLVECWLNGHKHVTHLPVSDFFIGWPGGLTRSVVVKWSDELKSLTVHNSVRTLFVAGNYSPEEIEDILNSVTVFNSIQKLWLWGVSETFVIQLVSQHKHSLRERSETWRHLESVTLEAVRMSGDSLCSLVDTILQLPESVNVRLWGCGIRHGTRDWKAYIRSHPRLTVDVVDVDVDVDVVRDILYNVGLLEFHT